MRTPTLVLLASAAASVVLASPPAFVTVVRRSTHLDRRQNPVGDLASLVGGAVGRPNGAADTSSSSSTPTSVAQATSSSVGTTSATETSTSNTVSLSSSSATGRSVLSTASLPSRSPSTAPAQTSQSPSSSSLSYSSSATVLLPPDTSSADAADTSPTPPGETVFSTKTLTLTGASALSSASTAIAGLTKDSTSSSGSHSRRTWAIVGGVLGGVVLLLLLIFLAWRLSQRRFSAIDDSADDIRWPELRADGQMISTQASTLNPLGTRPTGGAGVSMGEDDEAVESESSLGSHEGMGIASVASGYRHEPYLGASAAPYPPPEPLYPISAYHTSASSHSYHPSANFSSGANGVSLTSHSSRGHSSAHSREILSSHGHSTSSHGSHFDPYMVERPTGTPLLTNVPLGGISLDRAASPQVGQLRARNL